MAHLRHPVLLVVEADRPVLEPDVARVELPLVLEDGHQALLPASDEEIPYGPVIDGQVAVAIKDIEGPAELRQRPDERAAGAHEEGPVEGVVDPDAPLCPVAIALDDHLPQVADAKDEAGQARLAQQPDLVREERLARDLDQQLRHPFRDRPQPGRQAAREDGHRQVGGFDRLRHRRSQLCATTLLPSKSNRNRTSWRPFSRMACRSLRLSPA